MAATTSQQRKTKQERARLRRQAKKSTEALNRLYKPIEEWDDEELARGRPRNSAGTFSGRTPEWISRNVHEEAIRRFKDVAQQDMRALVPHAIQAVERVLLNDDEDEKGKPVVPASVKLDAAKWVVEHLVGKPTQRVEADISVRLQGILANVLVNDEQGLPAIDVESWEDEEEDEASSED